MPKISELGSQTIVGDGRTKITGTNTATTTATEFIDTADQSIAGSVTTTPASSSTAIKSGVYGEAIHNSANAIVNPGHNIGVFGRGDNAGAGLADYVIGVEGRVDCVVGTITTGAAFTATFGTDTDNAGSITNAVGYYMPDQADDAHLGTQYAFLNQWATGIVRTEGQVYIGKDIDFDATIESTVGNKTINKSAGRVGIDAGTQSLVVTNNLVTANSVVLLTMVTLDATAIIGFVTAASGQFTITTNSNATVDTYINFLVVN